MLDFGTLNGNTIDLIISQNAETYSIFSNFSICWDFANKSIAMDFKSAACCFNVMALWFSRFTNRLNFFRQFNSTFCKLQSLKISIGVCIPIKCYCVGFYFDYFHLRVECSIGPMKFDSFVLKDKLFIAILVEECPIEGITWMHFSRFRWTNEWNCWIYFRIYLSREFILHLKLINGSIVPIGQFGKCVFTAALFHSFFYCFLEYLKSTLIFAWFIGFIEFGLENWPKLFGFMLRNTIQLRASARRSVQFITWNTWITAALSRHPFAARCIWIVY